VPKLRKQDLSKEAGGVWREFEGIRFLIARINNPNTDKIRDAWAAENRSLKEANKPERSSEALWLKILSSAVLLGWDGLDGDDDKPLPYSEEAAHELLSNPKHADFKSWVELESARRKNFLEAGDKLAEKKSSPLSPLNSLPAETSGAR
jgi:hypothetical protein